MQRIYGTAFLERRRTEGAPPADRGSEEARPQKGRTRDRLVHVPSLVARAPPSGSPRERCSGTRSSNYMRSVLVPAGYVEVKAPIIFNKSLWETSGHWQHYRDNMFVIESGEEVMALKAMNCPGHMLIFGSEVRSYRDLPIRLSRADAAPPQRSVRRPRRPDPRPAVFAGRRPLLRERGSDRLRGRGAAAPREARARRFRPRLHGQAVDAAGAVPGRGGDVGPRRGGAQAGARVRGPALHGQRRGRRVLRSEDRLRHHRCHRPAWQCATIQLDYQIPQRFGLKYVGSDNAEHPPVVIHRAIFGSFERFIALLIEHYAGAFPLWLAPVQAVVLPIADRHLDYARDVERRLAAAGLRVEMDGRQEKIGYKIREAQLQKVPYMLVVGDKEAAQRKRGRSQPAAGDQGSRPARRLRSRRPARGGAEACGRGAAERLSF